MGEATTISANHGSDAPAVLSRRSAIGLLGTVASATAAGFLPSSALAADDPPTSPRRASAATGGSPVPLPQSRAEAHRDIISPARLHEQAKTAMPAGAYEYVHGAAGDGWTAEQNIERLRTLTLVPRRLAGFADADTASALFGRNVEAPLYVCPMGAQDIVHADAELATARGAAAAGVPYMLTSASNRSLEEVSQAVPLDHFRLFAIYLNEDEAANRSLVERARAAGYGAVVLTVDSLGPGESERYRQMGAPRSAQAGLGDFDPARGGKGEFLKLKRDFSPDDARRMREWSGLPVAVKGILRPEDAERSLAAGAAGVVVSNHRGPHAGGRTSGD